MYCIEPLSKKQKMESSQDSQQEINNHDKGMLEDSLEVELTQKLKEKSPILENKERSFSKFMKNANNAALKRLSRFPRTILDGNVVESKFFSPPVKEEIHTTEGSPMKSPQNKELKLEIDSQCTEIPDSQPMEMKTEPVHRNPFKTTPEKPITKTETEVKSIDVTDVKIHIEHKTEIDIKCIDKLDLQNFAFQSRKQNQQYKKLLKSTPEKSSTGSDIDSQCTEIPDSQETLSSSQKENSPQNSPVKCSRASESPILKPSPRSKNPLKARPLEELMKPVDLTLSDDSVVENTYPLEKLVTPVDSQVSTK